MSATNHAALQIGLVEDALRYQAPQCKDGTLERLLLRCEAILEKVEPTLSEPELLQRMSELRREMQVLARPQ